MKLLFTNKPRKLIPFALFLVISSLTSIILVQADLTIGSQVPPTNTPATPLPEIQSGSDAGSIYLPAVIGGVQPTNTPVPPPPGSDREFFISPSGDDGRSGLSTGEAWATFERAWSDLEPGDTLTLLDGVYYQSIHPQSAGEIGNPVTVRAQNDGQAIIDGEGERIPVLIEKYRQSYLVIEGIVARDSIDNAIAISGDHNVLRRISAHDANTDGNSHVIGIGGDYNLVEDCVAYGTGRKMVLIYGKNAEHNIIRRCVSDWHEWDGRGWSSCWPWGEGYDLYGTSYNIIENSISYSRSARTGVSIISQGEQQAIGNKILGTMSVLAGMKEDGSTPMIWGDTRPQPTKFTCVADQFGWPLRMSGFGIYASGSTIRDNLLQDILSWGNARYGISFSKAATNNIGNNHINRATVFNNGLNNPEPSWGGMGAGAKDTELGDFTSITNSTVENILTGSSFTSQSGEGARLAKRYVDGVLTNEALWPWPMEERIKAELGYSVTCIMGTIINDAYAQGKAAEGIDMTSRDPNWASDSDNLVVQACNNQ